MSIFNFDKWLESQLNCLPLQKLLLTPIFFVKKFIMNILYCSDYQDIACIPIGSFISHCNIYITFTLHNLNYMHLH